MYPRSSRQLGKLRMVACRHDGSPSSLHFNRLWFLPFVGGSTMGGSVTSIEKQTPGMLENIDKHFGAFY